MMRASGTTAVVDAAACRTSTARARRCATGSSAAGPGATSTGSGPHLASAVHEDELLLLADAQTSGGLLVVGEVPGAPVVGEVVLRRDAVVEVR
jgi:selenide,water dikinase